MSETTTPAADICAALGITIVPNSVRRSTLGELECCCERTIDRMISRHGEGHVIFVLKTITETVNNKRELVAPTIEAVSDIALGHPDWAERASEWLDAFDALDLPALRSLARQNLRVVRVREAMAAMIFERLAPTFGNKRLV